MSWMNKKTGRPREQGGHRTFHVSVNNRIFRILEIPENRSKHIEKSVNAHTKTKWIAFHESDVTANDNCNVFEPAATNIWVPDDSLHNGIISTLCTFEYRCTGRAILFRIKMNDSLTSPIEVPGTATWCLSDIFTESSFDGEMDVQPNQNSYVIEFQFEPYGSSDCAYVRDISMFIEVVDGLPSFPL